MPTLKSHTAYKNLQLLETAEVKLSPCVHEIFLEFPLLSALPQTVFELLGYKIMLTYSSYRD